MFGRLFQSLMSPGFGLIPIIPKSAGSGCGMWVQAPRDPGASRAPQLRPDHQRRWRSALSLVFERPAAGADQKCAIVGALDYASGHLVHALSARKDDTTFMT